MIKFGNSQKRKILTKIRSNLIRKEIEGKNYKSFIIEPNE